MMIDTRNIVYGHEIPKENYCDQPYFVATRDGNWLCVLTTGPGLESQKHQHVVAAISADKGRTWSPLIDIEPSWEQMSSWVSALTVPSGRVYAIYDYDADGGSSMHGGWLCYRYSDDNGRSWSAKRYRIPMRITKQDRENDSSGVHQYFWCIDKPVVSQGAVYFGLPKLHKGYGLVDSEGWVYRSDNILTEADADKIHWELLPEGDTGISNPALGAVQEEQNIEVLSDGSLYMAHRTEIGHPGYTISRDGGRTWTTPQVMRDAYGRPLKTPRACPRVWKASNGQFVFWFHNNSFPGWGNSNNRNPVWLAGGIEQHGDILWSQPEILLYTDDPTIIGMSYPDFVEQDGHYYVSETQKMLARVHEIDPSLLEGLWSQHLNRTVARRGVVYQSGGPLAAGATVAIPPMPSLKDGGFSVEMWLRLDQITPGQPVLSSLGTRRRGFQISTADKGALKIEFSDGHARRWIEVLDGTDLTAGIRAGRILGWTTDEGCIRAGALHHVVFIVDGLSKVLSIVVDGRLCDGGTARIQGWWWLNRYMHELNDDGTCRVGDRLVGEIVKLRLYDRYLRTSEAVGNWRAGSQAE